MAEAKFRADRFAELMEKRGFTDGKLAYLSGVSRTMIFYMKKGEREKVSVEILTPLARELGTSVQYLSDQTDDPSPTQKTMSTIAADIVNVIEELPPSKQREFQKIAESLLDIERKSTVETIYSELMERITRLAEIEGGEEALERLIDHLSSASGRSSGGSGPSVPRRSRRRRMKDEGESTDEPTQSDD